MTAAQVSQAAAALRDHQHLHDRTRAAHVPLHVLHARRRLDRDAAGIEDHRAHGHVSGVGSGGGREQFVAGGIDVAGSDAPLDEAELLADAFAVAPEAAHLFDVDGRAYPRPASALDAAAE